MESLSLKLSVLSLYFIYYSIRQQYGELHGEFENLLALRNREHGA